MRTFVQVYLLTILAMIRIQNFFNFRVWSSDSGIWEDIRLESYLWMNCESWILFIIDYASWSKMETRNRKLAEDIESQLHKTHHEKRNVRFERWCFMLHICRLNSGNFRIFELREWSLNLNSPDYRGSKIL